MERTIELARMDQEEIASLIQTEVLLTQMSAKKGIQKYSDVAIQAIVKEFRQLGDLNVFNPKLASTLTKEQMAKALRSITVIKEKRCGRIKGRTCADGRPQREYVPRSDSSFPTVGTESLILSFIIDVMEDRHVVTADVVGAFLKADMEEFILVKLEGLFHRLPKLKSVQHTTCLQNWY